MDIPALSMMLSQTSIQSQASLMIMKKSMDASTQNGQAITDLVATSTPRISPAHLGQSVDISA